MITRRALKTLVFLLLLPSVSASAVETLAELPLSFKLTAEFQAPTESNSAGTSLKFKTARTKLRNREILQLLGFNPSSEIFIRVTAENRTPRALPGAEKQVIVRYAGVSTPVPQIDSFIGLDSVVLSAAFDGSVDFTGPVVATGNAKTGNTSQSVQVNLQAVTETTSEVAGYSISLHALLKGSASVGAKDKKDASTTTTVSHNQTSDVRGSMTDGSGNVGLLTGTWNTKGKFTLYAPPVAIAPSQLGTLHLAGGSLGRPGGLMINNHVAIGGADNELLNPGLVIAPGFGLTKTGSGVLIIQPVAVAKGGVLQTPAGP
jgi:hypothetical protein